VGAIVEVAMDYALGVLDAYTVLFLSGVYTAQAPGTGLMVAVGFPCIEPGTPHEIDHMVFVPQNPRIPRIPKQLGAIIIDEDKLNHIGVFGNGSQIHFFLLSF